MIVLVAQTKTNRNLEYRFRNGEREPCVVEVPFKSKPGLNAAMLYAAGYELTLRFNPSEGGSFAERMSFKILSHGEQIGHIIGRTRKTGRFLGGYHYYELQLRGLECEVYEVGFGKYGLFLCLYRGNTLFAIAEKDLTVLNFKDTYTLYLPDPADFEPASLFLTYYDITQYTDWFESETTSVQHYRVISTNKELIQKYDAEFIERVRRMEE